MTEKQVFLLLTASFMSAMAEAEYRHDRIQRALELAVKFDKVAHLNLELAAFEYAKWIVSGGGRPPTWLPAGFNHAYLG